MVLHSPGCGRVGRRRHSTRTRKRPRRKPAGPFRSAGLPESSGRTPCCSATAVRFRLISGQKRTAICAHGCGPISSGAPTMRASSRPSAVVHIRFPSSTDPSRVWCRHRSRCTLDRVPVRDSDRAARRTQMYETQVTVVGNLCDRRRQPPTERRHRRRELPRREQGAPLRPGRRDVGRRRPPVHRRDGAGAASRENVHASLKKGDPVIVTGRLFTRNYEHQGQRRTSTELEAHSVAADLARCTRGAHPDPPRRCRRPSRSTTTSRRSMSARSTTAGGSAPATHAGTGASPQGERRPDGSPARIWWAPYRATRADARRNYHR